MRRIRLLCRRGVPVLLTAAFVVCWAAPGASAANRIYWEDTGTGSNIISFANLDGSGHGGDLKTTGVTPEDPNGIAMDLLGGKIYWADNGSTTISFANLNNTGVGGHLKTTGASMPNGPLGVVTDPAAGKVYWVNINDAAVSFANLNGTGGGGDLSTSGATVLNAAGVTIDPANGKIYWANGTADKISFANLDGSGGGGDLKTGSATVNFPTGVAIDPANGKIYWANAGDNTHPISFANLNDTGGGGNLDVSGATPDGPDGLAIDPEAGKLYWANAGGATISFAKLSGGGGGEVKTSGASPLDGPVFPALLKKPLATAKPKLSGGSTVGSKLSCSKGKWAGDLLGSFLYQRPVSFSYSWSRNGTPISGATTNSVTASSAGTYACALTAKNQAGHTTNKSTSHKVT